MIAVEKGKEDQINKALGNEIINSRNSLGLNQNEFCRLLGVRIDDLQYWEQGGLMLAREHVHKMLNTLRKLDMEEKEKMLFGNKLKETAKKHSWTASAYLVMKIRYKDLDHEKG